MICCNLGQPFISLTFISFCINSTFPLIQPFNAHIKFYNTEIETLDIFSPLLVPLSECESSAAVDEHPSVSEDGDAIEDPNGTAVMNGGSEMEPHVGMEFESEEAAKAFYDAYAARVGFVVRVDAFRRSMRDGKVVWRRLVCNKEGFRKLRPKRSESRKPRAITREGCKAMIVVKKEKTGNWVVTRFVKEHNHPLVLATTVNCRRNHVVVSQTPDEKDMKIRELTAELQRERKRSAAYQEQLGMVLREMEEHCDNLSRNIDQVVRSVKQVEMDRVVLPHIQQSL